MHFGGKYSFRTIIVFFQRDFGVYTHWVMKNFRDIPSEAEYEALINEAEQQGHIDRDTAYQVYTASMGYEATFFGSV